MPAHHERRVLPFAPEALFDIVADVERYPEFLPWCIGARVHDRPKDMRGDRFEADLIIGFKMLRESFTSIVALDRPRSIEVSYARGPLKHLTNRWLFHPHPEGCEIEFFVDFEFRSRLLRQIMSPLFHEAVRRMVRAFEARAHALHGGTGASAYPRAV